ncbi:unnamed protein product [Prunus armeniaca]
MKKFELLGPAQAEWGQPSLPHPQDTASAQPSPSSSTEAHVTPGPLAPTPASSAHVSSKAQRQHAQPTPHVRPVVSLPKLQLVARSHAKAQRLLAQCNPTSHTRPGASLLPLRA